MYGLIGKIQATPGRRADLGEILAGIGAMSGCLSYVVAADPSDADVLWVTEVWESAAAHTASLVLPGVRAAIAEGRPLIAGFPMRVETAPIAGIGLG